jgi:hypothetical protein
MEDALTNKRHVQSMLTTILTSKARHGIGGGDIPGHSKCKPLQRGVGIGGPMQLLHMRPALSQ